MGFSLGGSYGSTSSNSSSTGTSTPTYSGGQSSLQAALASVLGSILPSVSSGGISPNVQATETGSADTINKSYDSLGKRMNQFLASRGFGQSGQVGQTQLQTELSRQGALAGNASAAAGNQLNLTSSFLNDALMYAFANPGQQSSATGSGSSSGYNVGFGVGGKL